MLIRFFKENDLIGCGGDHQPIRLQVETLSQSDYRCAPQGLRAQGMRAQGLHVQGLCAQGLCAGVAHARVVRTGVAHAGVAHAGVARAEVVGTPYQSLEPIRVVRTGVVGTLNQSV